MPRFVNIDIKRIVLPCALLLKLSYLLQSLNRILQRFDRNLEVCRCLTPRYRPFSIQYVVVHSLVQVYVRYAMLQTCRFRRSCCESYELTSAARAICSAVRRNRSTINAVPLWRRRRIKFSSASLTEVFHTPFRFLTAVLTEPPKLPTTSRTEACMI